MSLFSTPRQYGEQWETERQLAELIDKPDTLLNEKAQKKLGQMVAKLRETVSTAGWKEIIDPFIKNQLRPERLLNLTDDKKAEARVFLSLSRLVENLIKFDEKLRETGSLSEQVKKKAEPGEDEDEEEEIEIGDPLR